MPGWTDPALRSVITSCVTLAAAVGVFGMSFGVGSVTAGASVAQTCALSLLVFTGASQFSAVSVVGAGGSITAALGGALLLAARNGVYGLTMANRLPGPLGRRLLAAHLTIDESTAMAAAQDDDHHQRVAFWVTGLTLFVTWNLGTLVGALAGRSIDPVALGIDAAFPAAFVAMVWPLLRHRRNAVAAALGALICLLTIPHTPIGVPILCASLAVLVGIPSLPAGAEPIPSGDAAP